MKVSGRGVSRIRYALRELQLLSEKLEGRLRLGREKLEELIGLLFLYQSGNMDLETTIKNIDTLYEYEVTFRENNGTETRFSSESIHMGEDVYR